MADGDDSEVFRVEVSGLADAVDVARELARACDRDTAKLFAEPTLAARVAQGLAQQHAFGVMLRIDRALPVDLPRVVLRGGFESVSVHLEDARGSVALMAHAPDNVLLHLSGFHATPRDVSDALYLERVALCRRERALLSKPPPPSHPLVVTQLPLRAGSFGRLAIARELASGFRRYLLCLETDVAHGADIARHFAGVEGFRDYVLRVPAEGDTLVAAILAVGASDFRVEWTGAPQDFLRRGYGYARIARIELEASGGRPRLDVLVSHHRGDLEAVRAAIEARAGRRVASVDTFLSNMR